MNDPLPKHRRIDVSARIGGDNPGLAFRTAVHLAIYWAQDLCSSLIRTIHTSSSLTKEIKRGLPLREEEMQALDRGR